MDKVKRVRSANFSLEERDTLVSLVQKYQTILENKQSDASTWKQKEAAWESIQSEFNARSGGIFRSIKTLKVKYEGLKRVVRKKSAAIRSELYRTGGGKNTAPPLDNTEEQIKAMIALSTDGLESIYDSDKLPHVPESQDSIPTMDELRLQNLQDVEVTESEANQNQLVLVPSEYNPLPSSSTVEIEEVKDVFYLDKIDNHFDTPRSSSPKCTLTPSSTNKKWDVNSRRNLKSKKHPALIANSTKSALFDELTKAKLELVHLQKKILEDEIEEKQKVWEFEDIERKKESEFKEKERKWREEEYKLKLDKLRQNK